MSNEKKQRFLFVRPAFWSTLIAGTAIGIASQQVPEVKISTDRFFESIQQIDLFQEYVSKYLLKTQFKNRENKEFAFSSYLREQPQPGHPISSFVINRKGYSLAYDARTHNPSWVYEHLTADTLKGETDRSQFAFKEDEAIPSHLRATPADYKGNGLDQGHMAPAANHRATPEAMKETFYLTNICPQCPQFNRHYWSKLEKKVRDLTRDYRHVYVITGPLYLPYQEGKRRFVKYQVIGSNDVAVPSHFFKVILLEGEDHRKEVRAYILPNSMIPSNTPLENFRTTVQKVEKAAGMILFSPQL